MTVSWIEGCHPRWPPTNPMPSTTHGPQAEVVAACPQYGPHLPEPSSTVTVSEDASKVNVIDVPTGPDVLVVTVPAAVSGPVAWTRPD